MHRASIGRALLLVSLVVFTIVPAGSRAQSETRERQAAAEAYDQGTASYLSGDYAKAAEWFETANRLSPAAPALIQAARAHQQAGHLTRAATLALRLTLEYSAEPSAVQYGKTVLDQLAPRFVRVEVECTGCTLDVDGTLQESQVFFVDPGVPHSVTASFETGERKQELKGAAGSTQQLQFEAPPPPVVPEREVGDGAGASSTTESFRKPFSPTVTWVAGGVTAVLLAGSIISGIDTKAGVGDFKASADAYRMCQNRADPNENCTGLRDIAKAKLDKGEAKETRTTVLFIATGAAAVTTAVFALLLTDWAGSGEEKSSDQGLRLHVNATASGASVMMKGNL
jgi:hypothetical protein